MPQVKESKDDIDSSTLYQALVNLQVDVAKLQQDMEWIKKLLYTLMAIVIGSLVKMVFL